MSRKKMSQNKYMKNQWTIMIAALVLVLLLNFAWWWRENKRYQEPRWIETNAPLSDQEKKAAVTALMEKEQTIKQNLSTAEKESIVKKLQTQSSQLSIEEKQKIMNQLK